MKNKTSAFVSSFQYESKIAKGEINWTMKFKQVMRDFLLVRSMSNTKFKKIREQEESRAKLIIRNQCIANSDVTIVLIGPDTWKSQKVDFEIAASLQKGSEKERCGLIGIFLPNHPDYGIECYDPYTVPPRLYDNVRKRYAKLYDWSEDLMLIEDWMLDANITKRQKVPSNVYPSYEKDMAIDQTYWCHY